MTRAGISFTVRTGSGDRVAEMEYLAVRLEIRAAEEAFKSTKRRRVLEFDGAIDPVRNRVAEVLGRGAGLDTELDLPSMGSMGLSGVFGDTSVVREFLARFGMRLLTDRTVGEDGVAHSG